MLKRNFLWRMAQVLTSLCDERQGVRRTEKRIPYLSTVKNVLAYSGIFGIAVFQSFLNSFAGILLL